MQKDISKAITIL